MLLKEMRPRYLQVVVSGAESCETVTAWTSALLGRVHRRLGRGAEPALVLVVLG